MDGLCRAEGCTEKKLKGRGLCSAHRNERRRSIYDPVKNKEYRDRVIEKHGIGAVREWDKQRYERDKEKRLAASREYNKTWKCDPGKARAKVAKRHAAKLRATPAWANMERINGLYQLASYLQTEHGRKLHVDHIVPLQGKNVCGLHCCDNLQLLYAEDNCRKGNRHKS